MWAFDLQTIQLNHRLPIHDLLVVAFLATALFLVWRVARD